MQKTKSVNEVYIQYVCALVSNAIRRVSVKSVCSD